MKKEKLEQYLQLDYEFKNRCYYIANTLLRGLDNFGFMDEFTIDNNDVVCHGEESFCGVVTKYDGIFPLDLIYSSDEDVIKYKENILAQRKKEKEEREKRNKQREHDCEYQRYLELKRKYEN